MSRNFGLGQRDMSRAGQIALNAATGRGELSFSSAATVGERWSVFVTWAKTEAGINRMEHIDRTAVVAYGQTLAGRVEAGTLSAATAQNYVSAINTVMSLAMRGDSRGQWQSVSPTKDCGIAERSAIRTDAPGALDRPTFERALAAVRDGLGDRAAAVVQLARDFGLRSKEASLINARAALAEARDRGVVSITDGTKGGLARNVPITSERQIEALSRAAQAQGADRAMIPAGENWKSWREGALRQARDVVQQHTGGGLHDLRSAYACERYAALTGLAAPVASGERADKNTDREARQQIAAELGHGRVEVTNEYLGK